MAFVHDHLAVFSYYVFHFALSNQALNDCYVESSGFCGLSTPNLTDVLGAKPEAQRYDEADPRHIRLLAVCRTSKGAWLGSCKTPDSGRRPTESSDPKMHRVSLSFRRKSDSQV